jgi:hypothetical protein
MAVIIGYDKPTNQFIVNDPGTVHGKAYRYSLDAIENALQDYPTGFHEVTTEIQKNMIVIKPRS